MCEYVDEQVLLFVEPPTASHSTIRLRATGLGVGALLDRVRFQNWDNGV